MNFQANLFFGFWFMMFLELGKHVLWLCDDLESQKEVKFWFMIFLELGKHGLDCGFVMNLKAKTNLDLDL
jgi:hypothetical protein